MKLSYRRTILVGFAFFLICAFWQAYDTIIPKILTDKFGMSQTWSGVIMALDNVLALFLLPLFGAVSDKCKSKRGKRTPFIIIGTLVACCAVLLLCFADSMVTAKMAKADPFTDKEGALTTLYEADPVIKSKPSAPVKEKLSKLIDRSDFTAIKPGTNGEISKDYNEYVLPVIDTYGTRTDLGTRDELLIKTSGGNKETLSALYDTDPVITATPKKQVETALSNCIDKDSFLALELLDESGKTTGGYDEYILPAREAYARDLSAESPVILVMFIVVLLILLVSMGVFRSPAVALMPDVTPKPLRSKGNAIINLMGAAGGILILVLGIILGTGQVKNSLMGFSLFFMVVTAIMLGSLLIFVLTVREPLWAKEAEQAYRKYYPEEAAMEDKEESGIAEGGKAQKRKLTAGESISLLLILASVALWYMGYNAVTSKYSVYAGAVLGKDYNLTLMIAQGAAIVSYIPVGFMSSKLGRKRAILIGVAMLTAAFTAAAFITKDTPSFLMTAMFVIAGIGWATINVNSFPMVVELATGSNTGKYTGYYYTASMAAQTITPIFSGVFLDIDLRTLFPYAAIFAALSFVTMIFVKHGDSKPIRRSALEAMGEADD